MVTKPVARSNEAGIDEAEEDGRDEDELEDNTVKLDTSAKASSGRWVTSAGALERSAQRLPIPTDSIRHLGKKLGVSQRSPVERMSKIGRSNVIIPTERSPSSLLVLARFAISVATA
ncbi:hypothetical protein ACHAO4_008305 [Trichoderma viride]